MNNAKRLLLGQPKVIKVKIILSFLKLIKRSQTIFHAHTMRVSQVIRSKKSNFIVGSNFSCSIVFYDLSMFYWNYNNRYWYAFASFVAIL